MAKSSSDIIPVSVNRKALFNYHIIETFEAGLSLLGPEVKSLRLRQASLDGSFAIIEKNEVLLHNLHITPYAFNHVQELNPLRTRKLLLKRNEIKRLTGQTSIKGHALVPLEIYFRNGWAKIKLALAKGKKFYDKRENIRKKDMARELKRDFKVKYKE